MLELIVSLVLLCAGLISLAVVVYLAGVAAFSKGDVVGLAFWTLIAVVLLLFLKENAMLEIILAWLREQKDNMFGANARDLLAPLN